MMQSISDTMLLVTPPSSPSSRILLPGQEWRSQVTDRQTDRQQIRYHSDCAAASLHCSKSKIKTTIHPNLAKKKGDWDVHCSGHNSGIRNTSHEQMLLTQPVAIMLLKNLCKNLAKFPWGEAHQRTMWQGTLIGTRKHIILSTSESLSIEQWCRILHRF